MNDVKRTELWESFFDAELLSRYFLFLTAKKRKVVTILGITIAVLSCGPLTSFLWASGIGASIGGAFGLVAGLIGVYIATSGITKDLATATMAATAWARHAGDLSRLWAQNESGEDVWDEFTLLDRDMRSVDSAVIDQLSTDDKVFARAEKQAEASMAQ